MGLEIPDLDDWTFEEAVEDARKQIPVESESWTDHNVHDPGITILETLAWVAQTQTYRLDRVTDAHRRKYLELLDESPQPPHQATAELAVDLNDAAPQVLPAGTRLDAVVSPDTIEQFTTDAPVALTDATLERVVTEGPFGRSDHSRANRSEAVHFPFFGPEAVVGSTCYLGFDKDPFVAAPVDVPARFDLHLSYFDDDLPAPASHDDEVEHSFEPTVDIDWAYCVDPSRWYADEAWRPLPVVYDETNSLYEGGTIGFRAPADYDPSWGPFPGDDRDLLWIRCVLDDAGYEVPPRCTRLSTNVVSATHRSIRTDETLHRQEADVPRGQPVDVTAVWPDQRFHFDDAPVQSAVVTVGGDRWKSVESLDASEPDARHFVLDEAAGEIRFGDGSRGDVPDPGQTVHAACYVLGGGPDGNVPREATWQFANPPDESMTVDVRREASGGEAAESIADALERVTRDMETPYRAVTRDDYAYVATHTPGLRFGRARALLPDSDDSDDEDANCAATPPVQVVVVPASPTDRPVPSDGFTRAVERHLCQHTLLTDQVTVTGPTYVDISVTATVELTANVDVSPTETAIIDALDAFLHPLDGYDGDGWPFGRPLYRSEVYEVVQGVDGVDCVPDIDIIASGDGAVDGDGNVVIADAALLAPGDHEVVIETNANACGGM